MLCVTMRTAFGGSWGSDHSWRISSRRFCAVSGSREEKGSSMHKSSGSIASARAMPTRCFIPPLSSRGNAFSNPVRPTASMNFRARVCRAGNGTFCASSPSSTFCVTVSQGKSANDWNTIATWGLSARIGWPSKSTSPDVGFSRPTMIRRSVDLPDPDGPTTQTKSCSASSKRMRSRILNSFPSSKYDFVTSFTLRSGCGSAILDLEAIADRRPLQQRPPEELVHREDDDDHRQDRQEQDFRVAGHEDRLVDQRSKARHRIRPLRVFDVFGDDECVPAGAPRGDAPGQEGRGHRREEEPSPIGPPAQAEGPGRLPQILRDAPDARDQIEEEVPLHAEETDQDRGELRGAPGRRDDGEGEPQDDREQGGRRKRRENLEG